MLRVRRALNVAVWHVLHLPARAGAALRRAATKLAPAAVLVYLTVVALIQGVRTRWRRIRGKKPRLMWGPSPLLNSKYWSEAMRERGYESTTCVLAGATITKRADFDRYRDEFLGDGYWSEVLREYAMFAWTLRNGDVFMRYFDGGGLRNTPLQWWEFRLLRLAGKKVIVSPFGGDIAISGHLGDIEEILLRDYPDIPANSELFERRIRDALKWADLSIRNYTIGFQPRHDVDWPTQLGIDTALWQNAEPASEADGTTGAVTVVHAPNHRHIKGTAYLEQAAADLQAEGLQIDLQILEGRPNDEVRSAVLAADIVADQFVIPYGLFAVEAMAAGKPVLGNLSRVPEDLRDNESLRTCPIVSTGPETLRDELRKLVVDPARRGELGEASREFVLRYHSYEATGIAWEALIEHVWRGTPLPERFPPPA